MKMEYTSLSAFGQEHGVRTGRGRWVWKAVRELSVVWSWNTPLSFTFRFSQIQTGMRENNAIQR